MPSDLDQLAQENERQDRWRIPRGDLQDLASQQFMTHQTPSTSARDPSSPYLDWLRQQARRAFVNPLQSTGFIPGGRNWLRDVVSGAQNFNQSGLTGVSPRLRQIMPGAVNTIGDLAQSPAARNVFSTANIGGLPLVEAMWTPAEIAKLRMMYGSGIHPSAIIELAKRYLPGRTSSSIWGKANELGITNAPKGPYVRQPGSPSVAGDPQRSAQIAELLKKGMSSTEISSMMGDVSARTIRRYISENLNRPRSGGRGGGAIPPGMPRFSLQDEVATGDPEFERALMKYLQQRSAQ